MRTKPSTIFLLMIIHHLLITPSLAEYPVVINNYDVILDESTPDENNPTPDSELVQTDTYILYRNTLVKDDSDSFQFDTTIPDEQFPVFPFDISCTENNGSPRNFVVGSFNQDGNVFTYKSAKFVCPYLSVSSRNTHEQPSKYKPEHEFDWRNVYEMNDFPAELSNKDAEAQEYWAKEGKFYYKLDPPLTVELTTKIDPEDYLPLAANEKLVQGKYELGGAVVCARMENGVLIMYRLSCAQRTHPNPIQVFNPDEKLTWDTLLSEATMLNALRNLRPDLLEHNTGKTENRLYVRMKPYTVKLDKPGTTKALRDWYLLAPFYDPVTQTYRETFTREDFVADPASGFDPTAPEFDPAKFVKKLVPYTLPVDFWNQ
jgi:hypothetical protein